MAFIVSLNQPLVTLRFMVVLHRPIDVNLVPNYPMYVRNAMDFQTLKSHLDDGM